MNKTLLFLLGGSGLRCVGLLVVMAPAPEESHVSRNTWIPKCLDTKILGRSKYLDIMLKLLAVMQAVGDGGDQEPSPQHPEGLRGRAQGLPPIFFFVSSLFTSGILKSGQLNYLLSLASEVPIHETSATDYVYAHDTVGGGTRNFTVLRIPAPTLVNFRRACNVAMR